MTPPWFSLAFSKPSIFMGGPIASPSTSQSFSPSFPPPRIVRAAQKLEPEVEGERAKLLVPAFPSPGWVSTSGRGCWASLAEDSVSKASWLWVSIQFWSVLSLRWEIGPSLAKGPFKVQFWNMCLFFLSIYSPQRAQEARQAVPTPGPHQGSLTSLFLSRKRTRVELSFKQIQYRFRIRE